MSTIILAQESKLGVAAHPFHSDSADRLSAPNHWVNNQYQLKLNQLAIAADQEVAA